MRRVLGLLVLLACSHQHPASGLTDEAAALLANVPADTPYVLATLEPLPRAYMEATLARARADLHRSIARLQTIGLEGQGLKLLAAVFAEIEPDLSVDGMTRLGFGASPRSVFYGIG